MPRCTICSHPQRSDIDRAMATDAAPIRTIAHQYGVTRDAAMRHKKAHLTAALATAARKRETEADSLLDRIDRSHSRAERLYETAETVLDRCRKDPKMTLKAISTACTVLEQSRKWCELLADLTCQLKAQTGPVQIQVNYVDMLPDRNRPTLPPEQQIIKP
jgi:hypothetical protein